MADIIAPRATAPRGAARPHRAPFRLPLPLLLFLRITVGLVFVAMGSWKVGSNVYLMGGRIGELFNFMAAMQLWWAMVGWTQIVAGVLLITQRFATVAAAVLFGVTLNIAAVNLDLWPEFGTTMVLTAYALVALPLLLLHDLDRWRCLFAKEGPGVGKTLPAVVLILVLAACGPATTSAPATPEPAAAPPAAESTTAQIAHPALAAEIVAMAVADQEARGQLVAMLQQGQMPDSLAVAELQALDDAHARRVSEIVAAHGWPGRAAIGGEAMGALFLLVQHADRHLELQRSYLVWMEAAYRSGEMGAGAGESLALLTDRVRRNEGRPQLYGTQVEVHEGAVRLLPLEDPDNVDARRAELGLPPLAEYLERLRRAYGLP